ncbi:hypothetical protein DAI22_02g370580 [Oryza sativa Japonica Group]|nr:hypothetical protein DAI22_02g370580 [Oryza sativa Japonica Group]
MTVVSQCIHFIYPIIVVVCQCVILLDFSSSILPAPCVLMIQKSWNCLEHVLYSQPFFVEVWMYIV